MSPLPEWLRATAEGVVLQLHVQPGARRSEFAGIHGDALKVRLAAPPVEGKANAELIRFLAKQAGVARASVQLISGETSRTKRISLQGIAPEHVLPWAAPEPKN